ncbi:uncharacterized protein MELLADRAFT_62679 [Melampsora larici-populina 98AG31]|uniref:Uncharacterized protein n=1 Tax=Melampsora larici-populina (strain 98AG31 / pathotype 3-4-7) TaxID=747676 RepID=F4RJT0_MELLP|nr:uncharacterized protein MELLADRAFT_62679 [Melampsora larici-populina 98AG31]EGG07442.1 hypothetical protein MELLADRAFT_62679 [Melampsora larici-populina 98AG31]
MSKDSHNPATCQNDPSLSNFAFSCQPHTPADGSHLVKPLTPTKINKGKNLFMPADVNHTGENLGNLGSESQHLLFADIEKLINPHYKTYEEMTQYSRKRSQSCLSQEQEGMQPKRWCGPSNSPRTHDSPQHESKEPDHPGLNQPPHTPASDCDQTSNSMIDSQSDLDDSGQQSNPEQYTDTDHSESTTPPLSLSSTVLLPSRHPRSEVPYCASEDHNSALLEIMNQYNSRRSPQSSANDHTQPEPSSRTSSSSKSTPSHQLGASYRPHSTAIASPSQQLTTCQQRNISTPCVDSQQVFSSNDPVQSSHIPDVRCAQPEPPTFLPPDENSRPYLTLPQTQQSSQTAALPHYTYNQLPNSRPAVPPEIPDKPAQYRQFPISNGSHWRSHNDINGPSGPSPQYNPSGHNAGLLTSQKELLQPSATSNFKQRQTSNQSQNQDYPTHGPWDQPAHISYPDMALPTHQYHMTPYMQHHYNPQHTHQRDIQQNTLLSRPSSRMSTDPTHQQLMSTDYTHQQHMLFRRPSSRMSTDLPRSPIPPQQPQPPRDATRPLCPRTSHNFSLPQQTQIHTPHRQLPQTQQYSGSISSRQHSAMSMSSSHVQDFQHELDQTPVHAMNSPTCKFQILCHLSSYKTVHLMLMSTADQDNMGAPDTHLNGFDDDNDFDNFDNPDLSDEGSSDGVFDLAEDLRYKTKNSERLAQQTRQRHDGVRLDKLARNRAECSQYEQLAIAIHDYVKLMMGIERKRRGRPTSTQSLPAPPSEKEFITWIERKVERRRIIEKCAKAASSRYLLRHPLAKRSQLAKVEKHAVETHLATLTPMILKTQSKETERNAASGRDNARRHHKNEYVNFEKRPSKLISKTRWHSATSFHSEDEIDSNGDQFRVRKAWRSRDLDSLIYELDEIHITGQLDDRSHTSAVKSLRRGTHLVAGEMENLMRPPPGFPRSLVDRHFIDGNISRVEMAALNLSGQEFDIPSMIAHVRWLRSKVGS